MKTADDLLVPSEPRPPGGRGRRGPLLGAAAAFVAVAVVVAVLAVRSGDDDDTTPATSTTAVTATTTTPATTATTTAPGPVDRSTAVWPVEGSGTRFTEPVAVARDFALTYLGFTAPVVGAFQAGDSRSGEVEVRPVDDGPVTTIFVRQLSNEEDWSVLGAVTDDIDVTTPAAGAEIASPVKLAGRAVAFEGNVSVEVREDGRPDPAGSWYVTGGGDEMRPFESDLAFAAVKDGLGALVFFTTSAENGQVWEAAVLRVRLRAGEVDPSACGAYHSPRYATGTEQMEVKAFFNCDAEGDGVALHPVYRAVRRSPAVLHASLEALLRGPSEAEAEARLGSWFSKATVGMLRDLTISDGHAVVDFEDLRTVIPNASTSAGSARLLSQLDATVFQFPSVVSVEYRLLGSCEAFNEWLQFGGCDKRARSEVGSD